MPDSGTAPGNAMLTLPNIISFARLCAVPLAIWLVLHARFPAAFVLFVLAGLSDALDGWLARRRGGTALGAILDPLADKTLMVGMYVTLAAIGQLPDWLAILVVFRDMVIVGGVMLLWMTSHPLQIRASELSKANTALQITLVGTVLGLDAVGVVGAPVRLVMVILVTASTLLSGGAYVVRVARAP
jgi:cardiolipin synthase